MTPKLQQAVDKSGLSAEEVTERALKLWVELYDLLKDGWTFTAHREGVGCQAVDFELLRDDPNKENSNGG